MGSLTVVGTIDMMQNRTGEAQQTFERVMKIDPKAGVAANNLAWLYLEHGGSVDRALQSRERRNGAAAERAGGPRHARLGVLSRRAACSTRFARCAMPSSWIRRTRRPFIIWRSPMTRTATTHDARATMTRYLQLDPSSSRSDEIRRRLRALGL